MLSKYVNTIRNTCLPFWSDAGFDRATGMFAERLDFGCKKCIMPHRAMVQARQIYVYAHAALIGWSSNGADLAVEAMTNLNKHFVTTVSGKSSVSFSINPLNGTTVSEVRDAYTHAFVLFAIAYLFRLTRDPSLLVLANQITRFLREEMTDRHYGGLVDQLPSTPNAWKRQNPQMHLLEAYVAMEKASPGHGYLEYAVEIVDLFRSRLFDARRQVLAEYFSSDWGACPDDNRRGVFEPGHHYEWVWLLDEVDKLQRCDTSSLRNLLFNRAAVWGHADDGLIYDEVGDDRIAVTRSRRLWPHTEAIKAAATRHRDGLDDMRLFADKMALVLCSQYLDQPFAGGWIDHLNADLSPRVDYVPASSLYHLFLAASVAEEVFEISPLQ